MGDLIATEMKAREPWREGDLLVVPLEGDLDLETAPATRERLMRLLTQGHPNLIVDLQHCSYVDSSGVLALLSVADRAAELGGRLSLRHPSRTLCRVLILTHVAERLGVPDEVVPPKQPRCFLDTGVGQWEVARFVLPATPQTCALARRIVLAEAARVPLAKEDLVDLELAVGEAFANAVRHGSPRGAEDRITLRTLHSGDAFVVEITDRGRGFDRSQLTPPSPEEIREGGMGILYMEQLMDAATFESGQWGTTVRLTKALPHSAERPPR
jgi:anti-anti-sigma factor